MPGSGHDLSRRWDRPAPSSAGAAPAPTARARAAWWLHLLSLRARLMLFAVLCALPVFTLIAVQRASDAARIRAEARSAVATAADQLQRSMVTLLASAEAAGRSAAAMDLSTPASLARCSEALAMARQVARNIALNYLVADPAGRILCSGRTIVAGTQVADRPYFQEAIARRQPTVSGHLIGRMTGIDSLLVAVPHVDERSVVRTVTLVPIDARSITHGLVTTGGPSMVLALYDADGVLVSRQPDSPAVVPGNRYPGSGVARLLARGQSTGIATGPDGVQRLYETRTISFHGSDRLHVVAGQDLEPLEQAAAAVRRRHALAGLAVLALVLAMAALATRPLVLARVRPLLRSAMRVRAGQWERVPVRVHDEVTPVESAFNDMLDGLEQQRSQLESSERRYRLLFDTGADGVLHLGAGGEVLAANGAACRLLGRDEAALRATRWQDLVDPADGRGQQFRLDAGAARVLVGELRLLQPDGGALECEVSASLFGPGSEDGLGSVVVRDLTLRLREQRQLAELNRRLEARVQQRTADLETAVDDLTAFSYSVSHDLRAPMGAIHGFACVLQERDALTDAKDRHYLSRIVAASDHANNLIDGLLLLARITRDELVVRDVDLGRLAREAIDRLRDAEPLRACAFEVHGDLRVRGDARLLRIVVDNLVGNAWKFTGRVGQAHITVRAVPGDHAGEAMFEVRDDGAGFDPAHAGRLFEPFQRLHSDREFPGTGIGLATVQRVVRRHGGRVWAESRPGEGTSVFFTLREGAGAAPLPPAAEELSA